MLARSHSDYRFPDLAFGLDKPTFDAWWASAMLPEDASEYVHFQRGTLDGARFVCALKYFSGPGRSEANSDIIVQSYIVAKNLPKEAAKYPNYRQEAQIVYNSDEVQWLLEKLHYRSERVVRERVALRTADKIEELFDRTKNVKASDEAAEQAMNGSVPTDYKDKLATEKVALDAGIRFVSASAKERVIEEARRDKRAVQRAITEAGMKEKVTGSPPTAYEAVPLLAMIRESLGEQAFNEALNASKSAEPLAIEQHTES